MVDMGVRTPELAGDCGGASWPMDCEDGVPRNGVVFIRQLSTSPVAAELTIDDDSDGSIARVRFNLLVIILGGGSNVTILYQRTLMLDR